ncbi:MAG: zinc-dependent alcohol dehydrogenase family protein [Halofilum sp. (in: g-proteobacteria)]|nr:zinc-dependent alcohol dehydrogenase family protein [Halofilum sp. (in: g-proteobacteria)]
MRIRAAVLEAMGAERPYARSRPLRIEELTLDPPGAGEVLVAVRAAGLCHSDLSVINGDRPRPTPMALGHEASGVVEAVGPGVDDLQPGDHVVMVFVPGCGHCLPCAEGRPALCEPGNAANVAGTLLSGERRLHRGEDSIHHHIGVSGFADHAVVSRRSLVKIDRELPFEHAALFGCAVLTGVGAVVNTAGVRAGQSVAIVGLGGVGMAGLLGALAAGAGRVVAVDLLDSKLETARDLGATDTIRADGADAVAAVHELTRGGVDVAVETAGSVPALELAWGLTRRGGTTVTAGLAHPGARLSLPPVTLVTEERTLKGSYVGSCVPARDVPRFIGLFRRGRLPVDRLLTHTLHPDQLNEGFDRLDRGEALRQVVMFESSN